MTPDNRSFDGGGLVRRLFAAALAGLLAGCASQPGMIGNGLQPDTLPGARFEAKTLAGDGLPVRYWQPVGPLTEKQLVVYLEGDGRAWASRTIISADPTPVKPLAMWLARADGRPNVAYLARPCQYGGAGQSPCSPRYWSSHRFAPEVVARLSQALDALKTATGVTSFELIGYSGGGALAVLLAARRHDVAALQTIAGNLDHAAWSTWHGVSPLSGSLNAAEALPQIARLPQTHWAGVQDQVVPPALTRVLLARYGLEGQLHIVEAGHLEGWLQQWQHGNTPAR
ncbi:alpha/beta hydrolase [Laribacter hongkongensis]|uniref:alpha/beta hydrolase n=1 Tax=Laribacter hongkongensis TaxID=168471 RepID=UPI001EFC45FC|nr:alpha/beta hydrolase [Laribacter hongkongensis]MCG9053389.1 alpha/beta hydrolase [Laribacter hongkongensis]